jgi:hypothetical protein
MAAKCGDILISEVLRVSRNQLYLMEAIVPRITGSFIKSDDVSI